MHAGRWRPHSADFNAENAEDVFMPRHPRSRFATFHPAIAVPLRGKDCRLAAKDYAAVKANRERENRQLVHAVSSTERICSSRPGGSSRSVVA